MPQEVWIYLEGNGSDLTPMSRELVAKGRELAEQLGTTLAGMVLGADVGQVEAAAWEYGLTKLYTVADDALERYTTDAFVAAAAALMQIYQPQVLLTGTALQMRDFTASLAAALPAGLAADCTGVAIRDSRVIAIRPSHGANVVNTIGFKTTPAIVSLRRQVASEAARVGGDAGEVRSLPLPEVKLRTVVQSLQPKTNAVNLADAQIIVSGGRGLQSAENYERLIRRLPRLLVAHMVLHERSSMRAGCLMSVRSVRLVKRSLRSSIWPVGFRVLCQHLAMRNSGTIVAINKDADAPIFKVATFGLVGDVNEILPAVTDELKARTGK